jgi:hypothetical protein
MAFLAADGRLQRWSMGQRSPRDPAGRKRAIDGCMILKYRHHLTGVKILATRIMQETVMRSVL